MCVDGFRSITNDKVDDGVTWTAHISVIQMLPFGAYSMLAVVFGGRWLVRGLEEEIVERARKSARCYREPVLVIGKRAYK